MYKKYIFMQKNLVEVFWFIKNQGLCVLVVIAVK